VTGLPEIRFDEAAARDWVKRNVNDDTDTLNGLWVSALDDGDAARFLAEVEQLVDEASEAKLFGDQVSVALGLSCDSAGVMDGAYVFIDDLASGGHLRLSSLHQEHSELTNNGSLSGQAGAIAALNAVAYTAAATVRSARIALHDQEHLVVEVPTRKVTGRNVNAAPKRLADWWHTASIDQQQALLAIGIDPPPTRCPEHGGTRCCMAGGAP
jgi:hypothetical protein